MAGTDRQKLTTRRRSLETMTNGLLIIIANCLKKEGPAVLCFASLSFTCTTRIRLCAFGLRIRIAIGVRVCKNSTRSLTKAVAVDEFPGETQIVKCYVNVRNGNVL